MKKQLLFIALFVNLSAMGVKPVRLSSPTRPMLKTILVKKYIDKKPLTKQEQQYLNKAGKTAIITGLAALGIAAIVVGGKVLVSKKPQSQPIAPSKTKDAYIQELKELSVPSRVAARIIISTLATDHFNGNNYKAQQFVSEKIPNFFEQHGFQRASALDR